MQQQTIDTGSRKKRAIIVAYTLSLILVLALAVTTVLAYFYMTDLMQRNEELQAKVQQLQATNTNGDAQPTPPVADDQADVTHESEKGIAITVYTPQSGSTVTSPLGVIGEVPGSWSFEADFPVTLKDSNGKTLAQAPAQIQGDWMTENHVPFAVTLTFDQPATATGTLILEKDNPSGLAEQDDSVSIPVNFQ